MTLKRFVTAAGIVAALTLPGITAMAQTAPAPSPSPSAPTKSAAPHELLPGASQSTRQMREDQMRATKLVGSAVYDSADQKIGSIADLILDRDGKVTDVVINTGG